MRPRPVIIDLSIDFDFFVREDLRWDWGHHEAAEDSENWWSLNAWMARYCTSSFNIFDETDPRKHADVPPTQKFFIVASQSKGLLFGNKANMWKRRLGIAESHVHAFRFFRESSTPADMVVNIDAHHDVYTNADESLSCENWVSHLHQEWPTTQFVQVYPKWVDIDTQWDDEYAATIAVPLQVSTWKNFVAPFGAIVRDIFICRSGAWTPPHLDQQFIELVKCAPARANNIQLLDTICDRPSPTYVEHQTQVEEVKKLWAELRQQKAKSA
jgi:hypothetical protein